MISYTQLFHQSPPGRGSVFAGFKGAYFLYDDHLMITFNYREGSHAVTLAELEESGFGSDLEMSAADDPKHDRSAAGGSGDSGAKHRLVPEGHP